MDTASAAKAKSTKKLAKKESFLQSLKDAFKSIGSMLNKASSRQRELRILVTGKTGQGKSTLINGILGEEAIAREGAGAKRCTIKVQKHAKTINGVPIKVFDSPGLQDRTTNEEEYIRGMRDTCQELSLVLYCTKMINTRLTDDDKNAMKRLTEAFGENFWNYAVLVLTFANMEDVTRGDGRDDQNDSEPDYDDKEGWKQLEKKRFQGRLKLWEKELQRFLIEEVGVNQKIAQKIPVVPTGDHKGSRKNPHPLVLPDRENWFIKFWEACCLRVKETRLFLEVNANRIIAGEEGDDDMSSDDEESDDHKSPEPLPETLEEQKIRERTMSAIGKIQTVRKNFLELEKRTLAEEKERALSFRKKSQDPQYYDAGVEKKPTEKVVDVSEPIAGASNAPSVHVPAPSYFRSNSLAEQRIHMVPTLAKDIAVEIARKEFDDSFAEATEIIIDETNKQKPGKLHSMVTRLFTRKGQKE